MATPVERTSWRRCARRGCRRSNCPTCNQPWTEYPDRRAQFASGPGGRRRPAPWWSGSAAWSRNWSSCPPTPTARKICSLVPGVPQANVDLDGRRRPARPAGRRSVHRPRRVRRGRKRRRLGHRPRPAAPRPVLPLPALVLVVPADQLVEQHAPGLRAAVVRGAGLRPVPVRPVEDGRHRAVAGDRAHGARSLTVFCRTHRVAPRGIGCSPVAGRRKDRLEVYPHLFRRHGLGQSFAIRRVGEAEREPRLKTVPC